MFYRENGQFKTSYRADQQIFPIRQDRIFIWLLLAVAFIAVPALASDYLLRAILIPFLILSLAAVGLNILVGYCGQISLGTGAFMAVGAYAAWNFGVRFPGMPLIVQILLGGCFATIVGVIFGIPSLRIRGLYLAVATLAAQFFVDWAFLRIPFFTNYSSSGNVSVPQLTAFGLPVQSAMEKYLFVLILVAVFSLLARTWCAAPSAASGWRSATWTWPLPSSASGPCTPSSPPSPSAPSSSAWPARCGATSTWAPGNRWPST